MRGRMADEGFTELQGVNLSPLPRAPLPFDAAQGRLARRDEGLAGDGLIGLAVQARMTASPPNRTG
jgi:hypothetical protein